MGCKNNVAADPAPPPEKEKPKKGGGKKGKKGGNEDEPFSALGDEDESAAEPEPSNDPAEDDDLVLYFSKAKKKKKDKEVGPAPDKDEVLDFDEPAPPPPDVAKEEEVPPAATAAKKSKKKKGAFTVDDEDLDKLLAEMEEPPQPAVADEPEEVKSEDPVPASDVDDAARKKSKKKKKKGGFTVDDEDIDKLPAEIEPLAEESEPQVPKDETSVPAAATVDDAEGKKSKKKKKKSGRAAQEEDESDKLLTEPLTGKQKEEAKGLEAMRRQFLEQSELQQAEGAAPQTKKKPIYVSKKKKTQPKTTETAKVVEEQQQESSGANNDEEEYILLDQESQSQVEESEEKTEPDQEIEEPKPEEKEEEEDEWDAKSWDDIDVNLPKTSAFDEEEAKPVIRMAAEPVQKQESSKTQPAVKKAVPPVANSKKSEMDDGVTSNGNIKKNKGATKGLVKEDSTKNGSDLRLPICCILDHVDTGKTKLLDCIRRTNVQEGEAGGITQQIGATYLPTENIRERTKELKDDATLKVPGLLVIDTPRHESFSNLRSRGSSLCDIAILVVDIMHGLEPQTIESLNLLKSRDAVFIVALNKVDRLYGWKRCPIVPIVKAIKQQNEVVKEFNMRVTGIVTQFNMQGVNTTLYYKNKEMEDTFNIEPTSARSGEGIPDLLLLLVQWVQKTMEEKLTFVDEVQVVEGHGTTIDVVLVNGILDEGDQIVVCGMQGPIITTVRVLLTPHPMRELRVKGAYLHHKEIRAAQGVKISAQGFEHAITGTARPDDDLDKVKDAVMEEMTRVRNRIDKSGEGVYVHASTLGSLEVLTEFLRSPAVNIPFCDFSIGPVHKNDVMKASVMLERKEYATILAFDVKVMPDAHDLAEESGVRIFVADIIYHLFDQFTAYIKNLKEEEKESVEDAVFPCVLKIMPNCVFNKKDPIVSGVNILEGIAKVGTPLCIPSKEFIDIGKTASIEINHKQVDVATKGQKVAIKDIANNSDEQQRSFGRHFDMEDELVSHISRRSIDILKENYRASPSCPAPAPVHCKSNRSVWCRAAPSRCGAHLLMAQLPMLLLLLLLVAPGLSSSSSGDHCAADLFDHSVNLEGVIQIPVFHRNHPCLRSLVRPRTGEMVNQMETTIDIIEDRSINNFIFLMPVKLGTPPIMNLVAIDTGSTLSWVQCQPCTVGCHEQPVEAGPIFDPSRSTTFQRVSCSSSDCVQIKNAFKIGSANCMEREDSCLYSISYGTQSSYSVGKVVRDMILVGSNDDSAINLMFGCSLDIDYDDKEAGIFGFGSTYFSFFEQMAPLISYKSFTYCLPSEETEKGYMSLGDFSGQGVDGYTPLFPSSNRPTYSLMMTSFTSSGQNILSLNSEMMVDSGSFFTYLSGGTFASLVQTLEQAMKPLRYVRFNSRDGRYICFQSESDELNWKGAHTPFTNWPSLPVVEIAFAGNARLTLPPTNAFYNDPQNGLCSTFAQDTSGKLRAQILGNRVTRSFEIIFDIQGQRFGFRHGAC